MPTYPASDGSTLHYDVIGASSDRPVLVLSGGAARHPRYLGDLAGLSRHRQLVVPHLRGVGDSRDAPLAELGSFWRQAADVESLRTHLGLERCLLVGHSAGTRLAISYAAQFPSHLLGMLLITPPAAYLLDVPSDAPALIDERRGEPAFDAAVAAYEEGPDASREETFNDWQHAIAPLGYAQWGPTERAHDAAGGQWYLDAARAYFSMDPPADLVARLEDVSAPVLVLAGAQDCSTGMAPVVAVAGLFPAGRAEVIDHCGHHPWVEQPAEFARVADAFLDSCLG